MFSFGLYLNEKLNSITSASVRNIAWILENMPMQEKESQANSINFWLQDNRINNNQLIQSWVISAIINNANSQNEAKNIMQDASDYANAIISCLGMNFILDDIINKKIVFSKKIANYGTFQFTSSSISAYKSSFLELRMNFDLIKGC